MWQAVSRLLSEHLGSAEIRERIELPGGDIHPAWRVSYGDNEVFVKCDAREQLPIFTAEADQLALLARSKSVRVPEVYGVGSDRDYSFLLLEYQQLKPSTPTAPTVWASSWRTCTSGASNRSSASTSTAI